MWFRAEEHKRALSHLMRMSVSTTSDSTKSTPAQGGDASGGRRAAAAGAAAAPDDEAGRPPPAAAAAPAAAAPPALRAWSCCWEGEVEVSGVGSDGAGGAVGEGKWHSRSCGNGAT